MSWRPIETCPVNEVVMTKIDDARGCRNEQELRLQNGLWWIPDGSMYVYYCPTHWKPIQTKEPVQGSQEGS